MKKVLIVEDDSTWAGMLSDLCERENLMVFTARSPQVAMDKIDRQIPDLIILDMLLLAETGMSLLNEMLGYDDLVNVPVLVCTNKANLNLEQLTDYGVDGFLDKSSMTPDDVRREVRKAVYGQPD